MDTKYHYAAVRKKGEQYYPKGIKTNLYSGAMPISGVLPSGRVWNIGSNPLRTEAYITVSDDGIHFGKSHSLLSIYYKMHEGYGKTDRKDRVGGAQYFSGFRMGDTIWIFYSICKERIATTKIPVSVLENL